ncbi:MAG: SusC/RagA family TonB-linked outer membrane protein [Paludibacter sp.]
MLSIPLQAQQPVKKDSLTGALTDAVTGKPLVGILVTARGISSSISDADGKYALATPLTNTIIEVTGAGYAKREISLKGAHKLDIVLYEANYKGAQKDVYTSTGDVSSTRLAGAVSAINENNELSVAISPDALLQGYASGVNTIFRSGMPGNGANFYLRGINTMNAGSQPLFVIDGLPYENSAVSTSLIGNYQANPLASIDVKDIESITVLKDGLSLYGVKGANGVVLIKTRKAQKPETQISAHMHTGISFEPEKLPVLNATEYRGLLSDIIQSQGTTAQTMSNLPYFNTQIPVKQKWGYEGNADYYRYNHDTDWQGQVYDGKWNQNYYMNVSGGDEVAVYMLSIGFLNQKGILKNTQFERFNTRFNSSVQLTKKLALLANMSFIYGNKNLANEGADMQKNPILAGLIKSPFTTTHVYNEEGLLSPNVEPADVFGNSNPYALTENVSMQNINYRFMGSFEMRWKINPHLSVANMLGLNFNKERERIFYPTIGVAYNPVNESEITNQSQHRVERLFSLYNDLYMDYKLSNKRHGLNVRAGLRYQANEAENDFGAGYNSSSDEFKSIQYGQALLRQVGGSLGNWKWLSAYSVADYSLGNKYFASLSATADATSRSGNDAAGFFVYPSVSTAWLVTGEEFTKNAQWLDLLKLRVSYGLSGNDDIGNYNGIQYYKTQNMLGTYGIIRGSLVNAALKPETVERVNAGLDFSVLNERVNLSVDVYSNTTRDMILSNIAERATGFDLYLNNGGSMRNTGIDLSANTRIINKSFKWDLGLVVSAYKNKVLNLNGETFYTNTLGGTIQTKEGQPLGVFYGYKTNGVYATQAEADNAGLHVMQGLVPVQFNAGDVRFVNQNSDNLIDENDRVVIGDPNPELFGSVSNVFRYKQWTLSTLFQYSIGNDIYNYTRSQLENMSSYNNQSRAILNRWRYEGNVTNMPKATYGDPLGNSRFSDRWIEDGSYIRVKNIQLSYELKLSGNFIQSATFFATGENLLTLTRYKGLDPEFALGQSALYSGIDACFVPQPRVISFGVNLSL